MKILLSHFIALLVSIILTSGLVAQFDLSVPNLLHEIRFEGFTGAGFSPEPSEGELDSNLWKASGFGTGTDGSTEYGGVHDGVFGRGAHAGGVTTGGIYAFTVAPGVVGLGVQPTGTGYNPWAFTLRVQNTTGTAITQLDLAYTFHVLNDADRAGSFNFSYSLDGTQFHAVEAFDFISPADADPEKIWQTHDRIGSISLATTPIANESTFYLSWWGQDHGVAGSRDEFALSYVGFASAVPEPSTYALVCGLAMIGVLVVRRARRFRAPAPSAPQQH